MRARDDFAGRKKLGWRVAELFLLAMSMHLAGCMTEFCTRHSDCPPGLTCGNAGVCTAENIAGIDGSLNDAMAGTVDASLVDAAASDAMVAADAMVGPDAMDFVDGGAMPLDDGGLAPDIDAAPSDPGGLRGGDDRPAAPGGVFGGTTGNGAVAVPSDGGLAP